MSNSTYNTKQKRSILQLLENNKDRQFSCEEITELLKNNGTPVGKTTVYRFLDCLEKSGQVRKYTDSDSKISSFQYIDSQLNCQEHMHLKCICCGGLIHLGCEFMSEVGRHILEHHRFRVDNSKTVILGVCENCAKEV